MRQVKRIALLLALLLSLTLTAPVWADVIDEPPNDFFVTHEAACEYDRRWYCANSPRGYVNFREAPGGRVTEQAENGARVLSTVLYQDWVLVEYYGDVYWEGWAPRSELSVVYDDISFIEECGSQFVPCDRELVDALLSARESRYVVYWPYPNAERARDVQWKTDESIANMANHITALYTDPEGYVWGQTRMFDYWVCLSALDGGDGQVTFDLPGGATTPYPKPRVVSVRELPPIEFYPAQEPKPPLANYLPALLVLLVVLLSGAALWFFYGKKRNKGGTPCDTPN